MNANVVINILSKLDQLWKEKKEMLLLAVEKS
jgi:hypothetical protein